MKLFLVSVILTFCLVVNNLQAQNLPNNPWTDGKQTYSQNNDIRENRSPAPLKANPWSNFHTSEPLNIDNLPQRTAETDEKQISSYTNQPIRRKSGGLGHISNLEKKAIVSQNSAHNDSNKNDELSDLVSSLKLVGYDIPDMSLTEKSASSKNPLDSLSVSDLVDYKSLGQKGYRTIQNSTSPFINYMQGMLRSFERGSGINLDKMINNTF